MDKESIMVLLRKMNAENVHVRTKQSTRDDGSEIEEVDCSCLFARWNHAKGFDRHPSMSIRVEPDKESPFNCYACGTTGTLIGLARRMEELDPTLKGIAAECDDGVVTWGGTLKAVEKAMKSVAKEIKEAPPTLPAWSESELDGFKRAAHPYILGRGFTVETCKKWGILLDEEAHRVVIPVRSADKGLAGLIGRTVNGGEPKYMNYWHFPKGNLLFGEDKVVPEVPHLILVEGPLDAIWLDQHGFKNAVAIMGNKPTQIQLGKLFRLRSKVFVMLDNDRAGMEGRTFIKREAAKFPVVLFNVMLPDGKKDTCDLTKAEIDDAMATALPL